MDMIKNMISNWIHFDITDLHLQFLAAKQQLYILESWPTHWLTHSLTDSLTDWLIDL